jgi:hypothetical protein
VFVTATTAASTCSLTAAAEWITICRPQRFEKKEFQEIMKGYHDLVDHGRSGDLQNRGIACGR